MRGRDPLLVWFARREPILTPEERERIMDRTRTSEERRALRNDSFRWWWKKAPHLDAPEADQ